MYKLKVLYFNDLRLDELDFTFDNFRDIFNYIRDYIDEQDVFELRIYRQ